VGLTLILLRIAVLLSTWLHFTKSP
jgi:hypothetical protein